MHADTIIYGSSCFTGEVASGRPPSLSAAPPGYLPAAHPSDRIAVALAQGRIVYVGPARGAQGLRGRGSTVYDFEGSFIMPGFHDAHMHFFHTALYRSPLALEFRGTSEEDCVRRLAPLAATRPADAWLLAQGWREYLWDRPVLPSKASLDRAYPDRPVALYSGDAHTLWLNTCGMRRLGVDPASPLEQPGYDRDASGGLTGIVREADAMGLMVKVMAGFSDAELKDAYKDLCGHLGSLGVTSVCDVALTSEEGADFIREDLFSALEGEGTLSIRPHLFPALTDDMGRFESLQRSCCGSRLKAVGLKQFFDGISSQHTAWFTEPYANPRFPGDRGLPAVSPERLESRVLAAARAGHAVRIHAIGDAAIHHALAVFAKARRLYGPPKTGLNCLEHFEAPRQADIARMAALDVAASMQPAHISLDPGGPELDLGEERSRLMWPFKDLVEAGAPLAFGSDAPVVRPAPLDALYAAITRKDPSTHKPDEGWHPGQCISLAEALSAYTLGGAAITGRAHELGKLAPGYFGDIAVFDRDLFMLDPEELQEAQVVATFLGGERVFSR